MLTGLIIVVIAVAVGAYWFQPWKLFTNTTVDEPLPTASSSAATPGASAASPEPQLVSQGELVSQEHDTSGTVKLLRLPDDSLVVRVQDLNTSDGPPGGTADRTSP